jgi:O-antigen ligase
MQKEKPAHITPASVGMAKYKRYTYAYFALLVPIFACHFYQAFLTKPGSYIGYSSLVFAGLIYLFIVVANFKLALYILIFFIPLQFKGVDIKYAVLSVTDIMLAEIAVVWIFQTLFKGLRLSFKIEIFLLIIWILITAVSLAGSIDIISSARYFLRLISSVIFFLIIYNQMRKSADVVNMAKALVSSLVFVSVYGLLEFFWFNKDISFLVNGVINNHKRILTFFNQPNVTAGYLVLIMPLVIFLLMHAKKKSTKCFYGGCWILNTIALGLTFSRSGWLSFAISSFFLPIRRRMKIIIMVVIVSSLLLTGFISNLAARPKSIDRRLSIYKSAIPHILEKPLLGHGFNTTHRLRLIEKTYKTGKTYGVTAHNLYLAVLLETGFLGLLGLCLFVTKLLWRVIKPMIKIKQYRRKYPDTYALNRCLLSSAVALLLSRLFQTGLTQLSMWTLFGIIGVFPVAFLTQARDNFETNNHITLHS